MFLKAGSGGGWDRVSGCWARSGARPGRAMPATAGAARAQLGRACVRCFSPGRGIYRAWLAGMVVRKGKAAHCIPTGHACPMPAGAAVCSTPGGLQMSHWRETFPEGKLRHGRWLLAPGLPVAGAGSAVARVSQGTRRVPGRWDAGEAEPWCGAEPRPAAEGTAALSRRGGDGEFSTGVWIQTKLSR